MATIKELEGRLDALEGRLGADQGEAGGADLAARVTRLEQALAVGPLAAERDQEERDRELLARNPVTYQEAVAQQAARERQEERDRRGVAFGAAAEGEGGEPPEDGE